ncbi:MAG: endonuclease domain-containing protein [Bacteroidaceae bacterium]|nr:endonuclease domain-containing protein [Bacteroidaceae bacterium]
MRYDYQTADPTLYRLLREHAAYNRNNPTEAESLLWDYLSADGLGVTFKRQHVIGDYIADFVCLTSKLIIELDGRYHQLEQQQIRDAQRTEWLESRGFKVIRFTNEELFHDVNNVLNTIVDNL